MQLTPSFIILLGSLLAVTTDTYAIPLTPRQRGIVTLPIKRTPLRNDLHPRVVSANPLRKVKLILWQQTAPPNA
jgi:hypothetical protein